MGDPTPEAFSPAVGAARAAFDRETGRDEVDAALADAGVEPTSANLAGLAEVVRAVGQTALDPAAVRSAVEARRTWQDVMRREGVSTADRGASAISDDELVGLVRDAALWRKQVAAEAHVTGDGTGPGGTRTDNPSCWYDRDGTVACLFDMALEDRSFVLEPARAPQHDGRMASLRLKRVETGRTLTPREFVRQTRPVIRWSVDRGCRFFGRGFDIGQVPQTKSSTRGKDLFEVRMRTLEGQL